MNPILRTLIALALSGAALFATAADEPTAWEKVKTFGHEQKKEAVGAGQTLIAQTDKQIAEMSRQTQHATAEAKAAHEANMKELKAKKKQAQAELGKLKKAGAKTWDATKEGFGKAYDDLHQAFNKARAGATGK